MEEEGPQGFDCRRATTLQGMRLKRYEKNCVVRSENKLQISRRIFRTDAERFAVVVLED